MAFAAFRRHQKKLLAIFAILAMVGFILSDSISRWGGGGESRERNVVVAELYGKRVTRADLSRLLEQRARANRFDALMGGRGFGGFTTRDLVDAYILEHEADRLGIPRDRELAKDWLRARSGGKMNQALFETLLTAMGREVDADTILADLTGELRLQLASRTLGSAVTTPLDVFQTFRDQNERSSFKLISFPAANYVDKVPDPSDGEARALYEKYKDVLPDPSVETPGFKVPRKIEAEILSIDTEALAKQIEAKLTVDDLKAYYENHKAELTPPRELPDDLFAGDPEAKLTPTIYRPFEDVRDIIVAGLSRERAREESTAKFDKVLDDVINDFADRYHTAKEEIDEATKAGETPTVALPMATDLAAIAKELGLTYERTPLLTKPEAENYGLVSNANAGSNPSLDEPKFAQVLFDERNLIYDGMEFSDLSGRRFLVRKLTDEAPHVAPFDAVKSQVIAAFKLEKARALAKSAAEEAVAKIKADGGVIKEPIVLGRNVVDIDGITRRRSGMPLPGSLEFAESVPADIPQIPMAGDALRDALFELTPGAVMLEPNQPKDTYYVATLARRDPMTYASLYGPTSAPFSYMIEAERKSILEHVRRTLERLRAEAGLPKDWKPPGEDEKRGSDA
ncbi:MAG: SurA N-terminal domain-containing protein [Isosphaeraceae bacterium]|nr:SurA N-terminal domain-containing protein [Isosphaeraceae bacterium]